MIPRRDAETQRRQLQDGPDVFVHLESWPFSASLRLCGEILPFALRAALRPLRLCGDVSVVGERRATTPAEYDRRMKRLAAALFAAACAVSPSRADDQEEAPMPQHTNRLAKESSPYLLQHAHNPVDWYPWGEEAFAKAKKEDKPVFLSIGYSTCHWCHVMERESFEQEDVAKLLNENFVSIKVDREERPDVDAVYMASVQAMAGQGGWPLSVFLTPEKKPFFGGTYFPPTDRFGRPGFKTVLTRLATYWKEHRGEVIASADELTNHVAGLSGAAPAGEVSAEPLGLAVQ